MSSNRQCASPTGGSGILMALAMKDFDLCGRIYWGFDSFKGLPGVMEQDTAGSLAGSLRCWRTWPV